MTIQDLEQIKDIINIKNLCINAGINPNTIATKLSRGTELSITESEAFEKALADKNLYLGSPQSAKVILDLLKNK